MTTMPREVLTGAPFDEALSQLIERRRWTRVGVLTGESLEGSTSFTARLNTSTHATVRRWSRAAGHGSAEWVEDQVPSIRSFDPDVLITAGGGSAHDSGKGVATLLALGGRLDDHCIRFEPPAGLTFPHLPGEKLPLVTVPSTLSGSEANGAAGFTTVGSRGKRVLADSSLVPTAVVLDPTLAATVDRRVLLGSVMNAINHCLEGLASRRPHPLAEFSFNASLPVLAAPEFDESGRPSQQWMERALAASVMTGATMSGTWLGIAHAVGHVLGATYGVPHGACHAVMAGACVRYNAAVASAAHAHAATALGLEGGSNAVAGHMELLAKSWGLPRTLSDLGVDADHLEDLGAAIWRDHDTYFNPRRPNSPAEIVELLKEAL